MAQERIPHLDMQWASQTKILQLQFVTCILLEVENDIKIAGLVLLSDYFGSISRNSFQFLNLTKWLLETRMAQT